MLAASSPNDEWPSVGVSARIDGLVLPGTELEVKPIDKDDEIVLRIVKSFVHGSAFRYDMVYYGLEPGEFNLKHYFQRIDGSETTDLPDIQVQILTLLEEGQVQPHSLTSHHAPFVGGYQLLLWLVAFAWIVGFVLLICWGRKKKQLGHAGENQPVSLAEQLRPLVESAVDGRLEQNERAKLEHLLLVYWQDRLDVRGLSPAKAIHRLKEDPVAGRLFVALENWLHNPDKTQSVEQVAPLLEPYRTAAPISPTDA